MYWIDRECAVMRIQTCRTLTLSIDLEPPAVTVSRTYIFNTRSSTLHPTDCASTCAVVIAANNAANAYVMRYRAVAEYHYRRESDDLCRAAGIRALCIILATRSFARSLARSHVT